MSDKKTIKGQIQKFQVSLTEEQKLAKSKILLKKITLLKGLAGTSKTFLAVNVALDLLFRKEVKKIVITRPFVYAEDGDAEVGILPGNIDDKLKGITNPVYDNMYKLTSKETIDKLIEEGVISVMPISFMRGETIDDAVLIIDEAQNCKLSAIYTALSRISETTKTIITGDPLQCDLKRKSDSGFNFFYFLNQLNDFEIIELTEQHRSKLVNDITRLYIEYKNQKT